jgi:hypothetical protein
MNIWFPSIAGDDIISDQISKFFVSHVEESMAGHMSVMECIKSWGWGGDGIARGGMMGPGRSWNGESFSFPGAFKTS